MRNWHSLYEILAFPIGVLFVAIFFLGFGNIITNPAFSYLIHINNDYVILLAEAMSRIGQFIWVNFPLIFLIRLVTRKAGSAMTIVSAVSGYITFVVFTMFFSRTDLIATAYSSILGISATSLVNANTVRYPLQTGILATVLVSFITLNSYSSSRRRSEYGFFSFIGRDVYCVIRTVVLSGLMGVVVAYAWPYFLRTVAQVTRFIASDTTNPINLMLYGILDRLFTDFNIGALIRTPFWYNASGGSWIDMAGVSIAGDVNIWTAQYSNANLTGMTGRFITPYYVLNLFAMPGLIWSLYYIQTDKLERSRTRLYFILLTLMSWLSGTLLPLEITLLLLCPLLYFIHLGLTGILYGVFQAMHAYLGFQYTGTATIASLPGTLLEFLGYLQNTSLHGTLLRILIVGIITFFVYLLMTRIYFNYLAIDLFRTGDKDRVVKGTIEAVGGIENVKMTHSSMNRLVISLYDPSKLNAQKLKDLGSVRIFETRAGYAISFGSASNIIRNGINKAMREYVRITE